MTVMTATDLVTVNEWFQYWDEHRAVSEARRKADRTRYDKYVKDRFGGLKVTSLTTQKIQDHIDSLLADGVGPFTVDAALAIIRGILGAAVEGGVLKRNAAAGIGVEQAAPIRERNEEDLLTDEQVEALVNSINPIFRTLIRLGADYGLSWSEVIGLKTTDFDARSRSLRVGGIQAVEVSGHIQYRVGEARTIFITAETSRDLAEHILLTEAYRAKSEEPWLFLTPQGTQPLRPNFNKWYLRPALEAAGIDPRSVTYHTLRHTAARRMLQRGVKVEQLATALGHKSVVTTKRFYGRFIPVETGVK